MPKKYECIYISLAELAMELGDRQTFEEKGRFIDEVIRCIIKQNRGVNTYADSLMDAADEYREDNKRRQQEYRDRKKEAADQQETEADPDPAEKPKAQKPKAEAYGNIAGKVRLTSEQYIRLSSIYGDKLAQAIDVLDEYLVNGGPIAKHYKDHSLVMKKDGWVYNRVFGKDQKNAGNIRSFKQMDKDAAAERIREEFPNVMENFGI